LECQYDLTNLPSGAILFLKNLNYVFYFIIFQNYSMPKTGEKCTFAGYYKYSGHLDRSTIRCHPSFDEEEISLQVGTVFPQILPVVSMRFGYMLDRHDDFLKSNKY